MTIPPADLARLKELCCDMREPLFLHEDGCEHSFDTSVQDSERKVYVCHKAAWSAEPFLRLGTEARTWLPRLVEEVERLQGLLRRYGEHRWKCAVSRQIRADVVVTEACDCGWQELCGEFVDAKEPG